MSSCGVYNKSGMQSAVKPAGAGYSKNRFTRALILCLFTSVLVIFGSVTSFAASLITADTPSPSTANLTASGTADWIHWGLSLSSSVDRKTGVTAQIGSLSTVGGSANRYQAPAGVRVDYTWSDGTPTGSATTTTGLYLPGVGNRFELSVPADTSARTLTLYAGGFKAQGQLQFQLSDGSAAPASIIIDNPTGPIDREVTVNYTAASAGQSLLITYTLLDDNGGTGNITIAAATLAGGGTTPVNLPFADDFSGNLDNWVFIDETDKASSWVLQNDELHQQNRVESVNAFDQSYHLGTFAYLSNGNSLTDYTLTVDAQYLSSGLAEDIGVMFRYQDINNYYRLALNSRYGFTRLEKKVGGQFTPLATDSRGYLDGEILNIRIIVSGSSINIYLNGAALFAVTDASHTSGSIALYTQDNAKFGTVQLDTNSSTPTIVIETPIAHSVTGSSTLDVSAIASNVPANGYVEFVLDDSISLNDATPPFAQIFNAVGAGTHKIDAILRDASNIEVTRDTNDDVSTSGDYFVAVGDSISNGIGDNYAADNIARFGRIIAFQGFEAPLTDKLNNNEAVTNNLVANEGVGGDESFDAAFTRVESILARHPGATEMLVLLGTNDALSTIPSGLGCSGAACDGTFKGNMQILVDKLRWLDYPANTIPSNITPLVSLTPPAWHSITPWTSSTNDRIRNYNTVIKTEISGVSVGADLFGYFMPSSTRNYASLFADNLHPNGLGTEVVSCLLYNAVNTTNPLPLPFVLDDLASNTATEPKQNLLEAGDEYYLDETFSLTGIPAALQNGRWIMPANADFSNNTSDYLSFALDRRADIYIAYDNGASALPGWMSGYIDTGLLVNTTDPLSPTLRLYTTSVPVGTVTLGGNLQGAASGADSNYVAIVSDTDTDDDGLNDGNELYGIGTDPLMADTDDDGLSDFDEVNRDGNPGDYTPGTDTDPNDDDTDDDGITDGVEVNQGTDPFDPADYPGNGDFNENLVIDAGDVLGCMRIVLLAAGYDMRCDAAPVDINGVPQLDGNINAGDILIIQRRALGLL